MKKFYILSAALITVVMLSCSKDEESVVDCFGESLLLSIHHNASTENTKLINFNVDYSGDHTFDNTIKWDFGDGTPTQTITGKTATHTYATAGPYTAKATVTLNKRKCSYNLEESLTVH